MAELRRPKIAVRPTRTIHAPDGRYTGVVHNGCCTFRGIRFAEARRFHAPQPVQNRQTPDAVCACPQTGLPFRQMSEDCLSLNVYAGDSDTVKPVRVYIHGGSFLRGSNLDSLTQGHRLAAQLDVIVVTVNYRLGIFGFVDFTSLDPSFCPNPAILDLTLALSFVKRNIAAFGGDPQNITVMGESAGGTLAALMSVMVDSSCFQKVILSSPVPTVFLSAAEGHERMRDLLAFLDISDAGALLAKPADWLASRTLEFGRQEGRGAATFAPAVDGVIVTEAPIRLQHDGEITPRPTWIGVTADEMSILTLPPFAERWKIDRFLPREIALERDGFEDDLRQLYASVYPEQDVNTQIYSDMIIRISTAWYAMEAAKNQPVWCYFFDYSGAMLTKTRLKAFHTIDLYYLFDTLPAPLRIAQNQDEVQSIQRDLKAFLTDGCLPWRTVSGDQLPARHYAARTGMTELLPAPIQSFWEKSNHYKNRLYPDFSPDVPPLFDI